MTAMWPFASLFTILPSWPKALCCFSVGIWGRRLFAFYHTNYIHIAAAFMWNQYYWPLHVFPFLKLACTDTHIFVLLVFANSGAICIIIFSLLLASYGVILFSLRAHSSEGRYKALSICGFHITVVFLFFVPCILIYARPTSELSFEKNILIFVNVLTPLLNPMVYTFRNKEMMNAIRKMWKTFTVVSDKF